MNNFSVHNLKVILICSGISIFFADGIFSASRFGIRQFDDDQPVYIGNFSNFEDVKIYADQITPQLKQIMKVPVNIYKSFIISKENFEKLISRDLLTQYLEFYKNNY